MGHLIQFDTGDDRVCRNITIINDQMCEEQNEEFLSNLTLVSGIQPITVTRTPTTIIINDTLEPECSKYGQYRVYCVIAINILYPPPQMRLQLVMSSLCIIPLRVREY